MAASIPKRAKLLLTLRMTISAMIRVLTTTFLIGDLA